MMSNCRLLAGPTRVVSTSSPPSRVSQQGPTPSPGATSAPATSRSSVWNAPSGQDGSNSYGAPLTGRPDPLGASLDSSVSKGPKACQGRALQGEGSAVGSIATYSCSYILAASVAAGGLPERPGAAQYQSQFLRSRQGTKQALCAPGLCAASASSPAATWDCEGCEQRHI